MIRKARGAIKNIQKGVFSHYLHSYYRVFSRVVLYISAALLALASVSQRVGAFSACHINSQKLSSPQKESSSLSISQQRGDSCPTFVQKSINPSTNYRFWKRKHILSNAISIAMAPPNDSSEDILLVSSPGDPVQEKGGKAVVTNADKGCRVVNKHAWVYDEELEIFLENLPKVELHVHLDGSFEHEIILNHLKEVGSDVLPHETILPWDQSKYPVRSLVEATNYDYNRFHTLCTCRGKRSLQEMIKCFEIFIPIVQGDLILLERLSHDFVKRQADQHVVYTEVRYSPHLLASGGAYNAEDERGQAPQGSKWVDARDVVAAITKGLNRGGKEFGVKVNQILCCITWRPDWAEDVVDIALEELQKHKQQSVSPSSPLLDTNSRVVGIDIAAGEEHFDSEQFPNLHEPHVKAFQRAKEMGINVTMHAGEVASGNNVLDAINKYHATRIGHGYRTVHQPDILQEVKRRGIHFETCPTSSLETGGWDYDSEKGKNWEEHPLVPMINNKLSVGLNSDDPAVFDTSLTFQYRIASSKMKLEYKDLALSVWHSIDAAFLQESEKEELRKKLRAFYESHGSPFEFPPVDRER